jgi:hypothetical protein
VDLRSCDLRALRLLVHGGRCSALIIAHITEEDLGAQFFIAEAQSEKDVIGKNVSYNQGRTSMPARTRFLATSFARAFTVMRRIFADRILAVVRICSVE